MSYFIKTGFWEKAAKGASGWLNLDQLIENIGVNNYVSISNITTELTDGVIINIASTKVSLTSSSATRAFTITYIGDDITLEVTLNADTATYTFPANSLCVSEGLASGSNILTLQGVSGDKYIIGIKKINDTYYVVSKNFGQ